MSSATYRSRVIVLRKTKLGESDLILTMLAEDGSQIRAVAKGARKPSSPFASRLELYSVADILLAQGKSLDIVKEARLVRGFEHTRTSMEHAAGASCAAELLDRVTQLGLENRRLFDLTEAALDHLDLAEAAQVPALTAATLLKTMAFSGFKPSLATCVCCGRDVNLAQAHTTLFVSYAEGGAICSSCASNYETVRLHSETCAWANVLLVSTFDQVESQKMDLSTAFSVLQFCQSWIREHVGTNLKSLQFLFTSGLFA
ncbi:DNA repair protein RecO [Raoultibacter phocaeensis]|uniref:DNA repair protein RecO n=1 Tax=Raoultibacter phocaeensis TaxID=2479841 RepID=UPI001118F76D|nr:DNA repair protein RecO [Raoultibacter phocaeensis]